MPDINNDLTDRCEELITHEDKVERAKSLLPDDDMLFELSEFFKLFGDSTRIKILETLSGSELCVCDISAVVGVSQSGVSHQLRLLRQNRLVKTTKAGKETYYTLSDAEEAKLVHRMIDDIFEMKCNIVF